MAKRQRQINHLFHFLNKHVRLLSVASDIKVLNAQVKRDYLGKIGEPSKTSVAHPKKVVDVTILKVHKK